MKDFIKGFFSYFTIWTLFSLLFYMYNPNPWLKGFVKTMVYQSSIGGMYLTYIYPRNIYVAYCNLHMKGMLMKISDFFSHHVPVIWVVQNISLDEISFFQRILWVSPLLIYMIFHSVYEKYQIRPIDIYRLFFVFVGLQWILY